MPVRIGVIAVGGRGSRLGIDTQKCLVPLDGRPVLHYATRAFVSVGVRMIVYLTGYRREEVDSYLADVSAGVTNCLVVSTYGGTEGDARAVSRLSGVLDDGFLYAGGDVVFLPETTRQLVQTATVYPESIAIVSVSPCLDIAPSHPRITLESGGNLVREVTFGAAEPKDCLPAFSIMGVYYLRPKAFSYLGAVGLRGQMGRFMESALQASESVAASITEHPWFCLHTQEDLQAWERSDVRRALLR